MGNVPVLGIGAGMAGIRVIESYAEILKDAGELDNCRFIAIDSSRADLKSQIKPDHNIMPVEITEQNLDIDALKENCPYLYEGAERKGEGALRDRVYGRFLFDINRNKVEQAITDSMKAILNEWTRKGKKGDQIGNCAIWIVHSLGGGTGSGTFPSVIINVHKLAKEILVNGGINPHIYCVGILPSATNIADITYAKFDKRYLANSFSALTELKMLGDPKGLKYIPYSPLSSSINTEIILNSRPFERYFIFGIDEELTSDLNEDDAEVVEEYLSSSNKVIANMMYTLPKYPGRRNPG